MSGNPIDPTSKTTESKPGSELLPTWQSFLDHPAYDDFWRFRAVQDHLNNVAVPTLEVGGWWDQEDLWGPQAEYAALEPHNQPSDPAHRVYMVLGPWRHGGWGQTTRHLGALNFGEAVGDEFRQNIEAPFFAYYLKDQPGFSLTNTATYQTGTDRWMYYSQWPPKNVTTRDLYMDPDGSLTFAKPADPNAFKAYTSDPANPVPYRRRPIEATYAHRLPLVHLARPGSAPLRFQPARRPQRRRHLLHSAPRPRPHHHRQRRGRPHRLHLRHRQRLGRQAHRRLPRRPTPENRTAAHRSAPCASIPAPTPTPPATSS